MKKMTVTQADSAQPKSSKSAFERQIHERQIWESPVILRIPLKRTMKLSGALSDGHGGFSTP